MKFQRLQIEREAKSSRNCRLQIEREEFYRLEFKRLQIEREETQREEFQTSD